MRHLRAAQDKTSDQALHKGSKTTNKPMLSNRTPIHPVLQLQQTIGNRAVNRMIQPKLKIGQPGDVYEQEADRMAEMVMRMPDPALSMDQKVSGPGGGIQIQRKCKACEQEEKEQLLQAKEVAGSTPEVTPNVESNLNAMKSGGHPLPASVRAFFEPRFGYDFSQVKIHTNERATRLANAINARAFTNGRDVVFGPEEFAPETVEGKSLLAHELTHVVQQANGLAPSIQKEESVCTDEDVCKSDPEPSQSVDDGDQKAFLSVKSITFKGVTLTADREKVGIQLDLMEVEQGLGAARNFIGEFKTEVERTQQNLEIDQKFADDAVNSPEDVNGVPTKSAQELIDLANELQFKKEIIPLLTEWQENLSSRLEPFRQKVTNTGLLRMQKNKDELQNWGIFLRQELSLGQSTPELDQAFKALGPQGYQVLPENLLQLLLNFSIEQGNPDLFWVRIEPFFDERLAGYSELENKISSGDISWTVLQPIIQDFLPSESPVVQALAKEEIEDYEKFETHIEIMTSILVLLLTIFPPTELLGITIGAYQGYKEVDEGRTLAQARGADDVISPEQQNAADMKVAMGAISIVLSAFDLSRVGMKVFNVKRMVPSNFGTELPPVVSAEVNATGRHFLVSELNTSTPSVTIIEKEGSEINYSLNELENMNMGRSSTSNVSQSSIGSEMERNEASTVSNKPFDDLSSDSVYKESEESIPKKKSLPDFVKKQWDAGNKFNKENRPRYPYNEIELEAENGEKYVVDSYVPGKEIVSRKFTQLAEVQENTAISYLSEFTKKYSSGSKISYGKFNPNALKGGRLEGELILEVPIQTKPVPQKVLEVANKKGIIIRDITGKVYN